MIDIEKLKQVALAATQGEWCFGSFSELLVVPIKNGVPDKYDPIANLGETAIPWDQHSYSAERYRNAEHIATANPSTVLELITRLEAAESQLETIAQQAERIVELNRKLCDKANQLTIMDARAGETIAQQAEAIRLKDEALFTAYTTFTEYAQIHSAKQPPDIQKTEFNAERANQMNEALAIQPSPEILQARDDRVSEACANLVNRFISGDGILNDTWVHEIEDAIRLGEWKEYL